MFYYSFYLTSRSDDTLGIITIHIQVEGDYKHKYILYLSTSRRDNMLSIVTIHIQMTGYHKHKNILLSIIRHEVTGGLK